MTYTAQDWLDRTDPRAAALVADPDPEQKARNRAWFEEMARRAFERECTAAGIDPSRGVSPSLLKLLGEQNAGA